MSQVGWPTAVAFDPGADEFPASLETLAALPPQKLKSLLLIAGPQALASGWAARTAVAVAAGLTARGRRVVLLDLCLTDPEVHGLLGVENVEGVADAFLFGVPLKRLARQLPDRSFAFVPAGAYVPDPAEILTHPRWDHVLREFANSDTLPVALVPAGVTGLEELARRFGAAAILGAPGEAEAVMAGLPPECAVMATVRPAAGRAGAEGEEPDPLAVLLAEVSRGGDEERDEPPLLRQALVWVAVGALVVLAGFAAWVAYRSLGGRSAVEPLEPVARFEATPEPPAPPPPEPEIVPRPIETPVPYSVQIEAHEDPRAAAERVAALRRAEPGMEFYVVPANVAGVLYYRVMAGPAADLATAQALMQRLVEAGHKASAEAWALAPTRWAFYLGDFDTRNAARARGDELAAEGIPTYVVEIPYEHGPSRYRLYAGAYRTPGEARVLEDMLRRAGYEPQLVERKGRPAL